MYTLNAILTTSHSLAHWAQSSEVHKLHQLIRHDTSTTTALQQQPDTTHYPTTVTTLLYKLTKKYKVKQIKNVLTATK